MNAADRTSRIVNHDSAHGFCCDAPEPGTLADETHCACWFADEGPCCWCDNDDPDGSDHPGCPS